MIHVCFSVYDETGTLSKFTGTAMLSLFENVFKPLSSVTVHILHDNTLTVDNREKFSYLAGRYGQLVKFYNVEELLANKLSETADFFPNLENFSSVKAMFYKFFVAQVLSADIGKLIYLEPNVIVNMDISELWRIELGDKMLAAVPVSSIDPTISIQDKIVADGFVKQEDYFNANVLLINLKLLRGAEEKISAGMKFANEHKYFNSLTQSVWNYCFSTQVIKLPVQFNQFVRKARMEKESVIDKIYCYAAYSLQINMNDSFNRLWLKYFAKTPWFDFESIGRIYEAFRQIHNRQKKSLANLSAILINKTRGFCATPAYLDDVKKVFHTREDEEIISLENRESFQKLIDAMKKSQGKKIFFIIAQNFPFNALIKAGFVPGRDFVNGLEFFSEEQGITMNSYPLLRAM